MSLGVALRRKWNHFEDSDLKVPRRWELSLYYGSTLYNPGNDTAKGPKEGAYGTRRFVFHSTLCLGGLSVSY
jgi:hypothetical protein